jgi:hypothetical protein
LIFGAFVTGAASLYALADKMDKEFQQKEKEHKSKLLQQLEATKIGTAQVDGGPVQDITVSDALKFAKNLTTSAEDKEAAWIITEENYARKGSRLLFGVAYGFAIGLGGTLFMYTAWPFIKDVVGLNDNTSSTSLLMNYWKFGMRGAFAIADAEKAKTAAAAGGN